MTDLELPFLSSTPVGTGQGGGQNTPFPAVFIRAPVVDALLADEVQSADEKLIGLELPEQASGEQTWGNKGKIEVLAILPGRHASNKKAIVGYEQPISPKGSGDIVALRQGNVFGMSFHPELTDDIRIHEWWLNQVVQSCR